MVRRAGWSTLHWALFYATGIASAFAGQAVAHSVLKPSEALPMSQAAEKRRVVQEALPAQPKHDSERS